MMVGMSLNAMIRSYFSESSHGSVSRKISDFESKVLIPREVGVEEVKWLKGQEGCFLDYLVTGEVDREEGGA